MVTVVIKHDGEDSVIELTYENIWREIKDIDGASIIVTPSWFNVINTLTAPFVSFVEADCLVNSGYFKSQINLLKKNANNRHIAIMSASTAVNSWANRFYGYGVNGENIKGAVVPNKDKKSTSPYMVQAAYLPGSIVRLSTLKNLIEEGMKPSEWEDNLADLSVNISLRVWSRGIGNGIGNMVMINPNATYVTTDKRVNEIVKFDPKNKDTDVIFDIFRRYFI